MNDPMTNLLSACGNVIYAKIDLWLCELRIKFLYWRLAIARFNRRKQHDQHCDDYYDRLIKSHADLAEHP